MIRLNDINKTVIDEKTIEIYNAYKDYMYDHDTEKNKDVEAIELRTSNGGITVRYDSKEARDKDIELLDKIFDVKSIEDKANAYPDEIDALKFAMSGIKKECEPVKEEYITWEDVKQVEGTIKAELPNGAVREMFYNDYDKHIYIKQGVYIYDEDLFNALKLKKVE